MNDKNEDFAVLKEGEAATGLGVHFWLMPDMAAIEAIVEENDALEDEMEILKAKQKALRRRLWKAVHDQVPDIKGRDDVQLNLKEGQIETNGYRRAKELGRLPGPLKAMALKGMRERGAPEDLIQIVEEQESVKGMTVGSIEDILSAIEDGPPEDWDCGDPDCEDCQDRRDARGD